MQYQSVQRERLYGFVGLAIIFCLKDNLQKTRLLFQYVFQCQYRRIINYKNSGSQHNDESYRSAVLLHLGNIQKK